MKNSVVYSGEDASRVYDRRLGMDRPITRRDFLNGVRIAAAGSLVGSSGLLKAFGAQAGQAASAYYRPMLTGMRGSHDGSWEAAHELRDGRAWDNPSEVDDPYDLIVVGGGISGLAAAYFFRKAVGRNARILVLDNHDDFGGHAKRNEFRSGGRLLIGHSSVRFGSSSGGCSPAAVSIPHGTSRPSPSTVGPMAKYNSLYDPIWNEGEAPHIKARQPFGRIAIANSDAAIDMAHRAVREVTAG